MKKKRTNHFVIIQYQHLYLNQYHFPFDAIRKNVLHVVQDMILLLSASLVCIIIMVQIVQVVIVVFMDIVTILFRERIYSILLFYPVVDNVYVTNDIREVNVLNAKMVIMV